MSTKRNNVYSRVHHLQPLRCPQCRKLLLTEDIEQGTLEVVCKRCRAQVRLEATSKRKVIKMRK